MYNKIERLLAFVVVLAILMFGLVGSAEATPTFKHPGYPGALEQDCCWGDRWVNKHYAECLYRNGRWYRWEPPTLLHLWWDEANLYKGIDYTSFKTHVCDPSKFPIKPSVDKDGDFSGPPATNLFDGRLNNHQDRDVAAPVAIYLADDQLSVYLIDPVTGAGFLIIQTRLTTVPGLIAEGAGVSVWRLPTNEYQVNASYADGKAYIFVWDEYGSYHIAS